MTYLISEVNADEYEHIKEDDPCTQPTIIATISEEENRNVYSEDVSVEKQDIELQEDIVSSNLLESDGVDAGSVIEHKSQLEFDRTVNTKQNIERSKMSLGISENVTNERLKRTRFLENISMEASNLEDISARDIFDVTDIEKTTCIHVSSADILDNSLSDISLEKHTENSINETRNPTKKSNEAIKREDKHDDLSKSTEPSYKMRLRNRTSSNTSFESPSSRTYRKRSASVDDCSTQPQLLTLSPSSSKSELSQKTLKSCSIVESSERILDSPRPRNRRSSSVSECISHIVGSDAGSKKKSKRSASVTNFPIISEENIKPGRISSKKHEQNTEVMIISSKNILVTAVKRSWNGEIVTENTMIKDIILIRRFRYEYTFLYKGW